MAQSKIIQLKEKSSQPVNDSSLYPITTTTAVVDYTGKNVEERLVYLDDTKVGWKDEQQDIKDLESNYYTKIEIDEAFEKLDASLSLDFNDKVDKTSIVNDVSTGGVDKVLSAEQGKVLNEHIDASIAEINRDMDDENNYININKIANHSAPYAGKAAAVDDVPVAMRKPGLCVTYLDNDSSLWIDSQFKGADASTGWTTLSNWQDLGPVSVISQTENYVVKAGDTSVGEIPVVSISQNANTGNDSITIGENSYRVADADKLIKLVGWGESYSTLQNVGDVMYLSTAKVLKRKITEGGSTETVPYYDGAIYTYNDKLYNWNGSDLVEVNDTEQIPILADKLIHLVAMDSVYGDHLQNVGDTMYLTGGKILKRLVAPENIQTVPYYEGAIYTYNDNLYVYNGTELVLVNDTDKIKINSDKLIKLVGMGTVSGGDSGVTQVGDVYYNTGVKKLQRCTEFTSVTSFVAEEIPFYDGAIYTYNNVLYIWNGTDLISTDAVNAAFRNMASERFKSVQTAFDSVALELGGIGANGVENALSNRARTAFIRAPFELQLNSGYQTAVILKYVISPDGTKTVETYSTDNETAFSAKDGVYRLVFGKTNSADITDADLIGIVKSFNGALHIDEQKIEKTYNKNLNSSSLWELGYYNSSGNKVDSTSRVRTKDRIDSFVDYIKVATGVQYYLVGWNASGTFVKYWDGGKFQDTGTLLSGDIDLATIKAQNQGYTFAIYGVSDDVTDYSSYFVFLNSLYKTSVNIDELKIEDYNKESLWVRAYVNSSGVLTSSNNRIATKNFIDKSIDIAYLTHVYPYWPEAFVVAYKADGSYVGIVQSNDLSIASSASNFEITIPLREIHQKYPSYLFRIVLHENTNNDITTEYYSQCQFKNLLQARMDRIEYNKPMITFIDDDGLSEQFDNWKLIYDACGICPTMALVTVGLTQEDIAKAKQYGALGFEYVSHSHGHSDLTTRTEEQLIADFKATTAALRDLGIKAANPSILVYPYNHVNDLVESVAQDYFQCGIEGGEHRVNGKPLDRFHIRRESILSSTRRKEVVIEGETVEVAIPKNLEEWEPFIDDLVAKNGWLVIMSHFRDSYIQDHYYFDDSFIQPVVDLCKYALSRGCEILTAGAAFEKFKNKLEIGKVTDEHHYIVDCNGKVYDTME